MERGLLGSDGLGVGDLQIEVAAAHAFDPHVVKAERIVASGFRLPTADEWEHACSGGRDTFFPWGNGWPLDTDVYDGGPFEAHAAPNSFGLRYGTSPYQPEIIDDPEQLQHGDGGSLVCGEVGPMAWITFSNWYRYRLEVEHTSGGRSWLGPVEVSTPAAIARLAWERLEPNPFTDRALLTLAVPRAAWATVRVFDLQGHEVRMLHRGPVAAGRNVFAWDGRDRSATRAAPGVYLVRAELEGEVASQRLVHVR